MINILICDDDEQIISQIDRLVRLWGKLHNVEFWIDRKQSGDFILSQKYSFDIAFIDIEMPGISGLTLAEKLQENNPDVLEIIITSFQNYLDDAMKVHVFRYLSKPIDKNRFERNLSDAIKEYRNLSKSIVVDLKDEVHSVKTKDILYIENLKNGSRIITTQDIYVTNKKPAEWSRIIDQPSCFVFSHHSFLVNLQNVVDFSKYSVTIRKHKNEVVSAYMSQRKFKSFKKAFFDFAGGLK